MNETLIIKKRVQSSGLLKGLVMILMDKGVIASTQTSGANCFDKEILVQNNL